MLNSYEIINMNELSFNKMIDEIYTIININKSKKKIQLPNLNVDIETNRLYWKNINEFLDLINRPIEHFINYLKYELNNKEINMITSSLEDGIIIHQKYPKLKKIIDVRNKYIEIYVICSSCNSYNTTLTKYISKTYNFKCLNCDMYKCI
jgi:translation initiation factor 2 beta subunit (eIF-2beta)/eIF-5